MARDCYRREGDFFEGVPCSSARGAVAYASTVTSLMYFGLVPLLLYGDGWIHRFLSAHVFRRIGTLGYGVYLVHIPIIDHLIVPAARALQARRASMLWVWPLSLLATMVLSLSIGYALHVLIEKPSLRFRERFAG